MFILLVLILIQVGVISCVFGAWLGAVLGVRVCGGSSGARALIRQREAWRVAHCRAPISQKRQCAEAKRRHSDRPSSTRPP